MQYACVCPLCPDLRIFLVRQIGVNINKSRAGNTRYIIYLSLPQKFTNRSPAPLGPSLVANAAFETNQHRSALMMSRMKRFQANNGTTPGTTLTTAALQEHENGGGAPGEAKIWVCWQARTSTHPKVIAAGIGYHSKAWAISKFMPDIKVEITKVINTEWCQNHSSPLLPEEVDFRWHGNRVLDPGTHTLSLNDFYAHYSTPSNTPVYLQNIPTQWKSFDRSRGSKRFVCLELYVRVDKWQERVSEQDIEEYPSSAGRKRARTRSAVSTAAKQPRLSDAVPESRFTLSGRTNATTIQKWSAITFRKLKCIVADVDGATKLMEEEIMRGKIFDEPFSSGTMKIAFDLILADGDQFVAKRFFKLSEDADDVVSVKANRMEIEGELLRLAYGRWFLNKFYQFCKKHGVVDVDETLSVADAFLAEEVDAPSTASGIPVITGEGTGMTWLVECKRPMTVTKYSGTLVHTSARRDLRSLTICAFAHFAFGFSNRNMVLQISKVCTPAHVQGADGLVLFDLMTHTPDGDSGIGDHGKQGIRSFTHDHQCNSICTGLGFNTQYPLKPR
ncbi:kinase-like domain-containing protein [Mycena pura]|uniref:Kinase-like domain-containing protein n=1 Tax=Mycena pura TaxID=153505 RepID=A0AAD6UVB0_9AGAR|nr:kinase-like domain-containing protein [Mycena pura]